MALAAVTVTTTAPHGPAEHGQVGGELSQPLVWDMVGLFSYCCGATFSVAVALVLCMEEICHPALTQSIIFGSQAVSNYETATNNLVMLFCPVLRLCVTNNLIRFYFAHAGIALRPAYEFTNAVSRSLWGLGKGRRSFVDVGCRLQ